MRNYERYFLSHFLFALVAAALASTTIGPDFFFVKVFFMLFSIPVGIGQLIAGSYLIVEYDNYPPWVKKGITTYWALSIGWLIVLLYMKASIRVSDETYEYWLFLAPWPIAVYQWVLIVRMYRLRKRQFEKREFLEIYKH